MAIHAGTARSHADVVPIHAAATARGVLEATCRPPDWDSRYPELRVANKWSTTDGQQGAPTLDGADRGPRLMVLPVVDA
jgi:hypothetical protein